MVRLTSELAHELIGTLDDIWQAYFHNQPKAPYPYAQWERQRQRVKERLRRLPEYVTKAAAFVHIVKDARGQHTTIPLVQRTMLLIFKRLMERSNRGMEDILIVFSPLFGFERCYKFVERLYSDVEVQLTLHNLFILLVREEGTSGQYSGDGTGYALTIENHYRKDPQKHGKKYVHVFFMIDIDTCLYVGYGHSQRSEMEAFHKALNVMTELNIDIESVRLDKYFSSRKVIRLFGRDVALYLIPKKNITSFGAQWPPIFQRILLDPITFLTEYFYRNLSETGHSTDKRRFGSQIRQHRIERQETETKCIGVLHNFFATRVQQQPTQG